MLREIITASSPSIKIKNPARRSFRENTKARNPMMRRNGRYVARKTISMSRNGL